jgi:CRP-like cAMP-binding protein
MMQTFVERMSARLKENPVFSGLDPLRAEHLIKHSLIRRLPRGEVLFEAGARCEGLHAVLDGMLKVYARDGQGHEKVIDLIGRGQTLPGTQPTGDTQHTHHARTLATSTVLVVPYTLLRNELCTDVGMAQRLLDDTSRHLRRMMRELEATTLRSARQRASQFLLRQPALALDDGGYGHDHSVVVSLPVSKGTVASLLSITPEHFSRILRELQDKGLIEMQQRTIRIMDPERLAACE